MKLVYDPTTMHTKLRAALLMVEMEIPEGRNIEEFGDRWTIEKYLPNRIREMVDQCLTDGGDPGYMINNCLYTITTGGDLESYVEQIMTSCQMQSLLSAMNRENDEKELMTMEEAAALYDEFSNLGTYLYELAEIEY